MLTSLDQSQARHEPAPSYAASGLDCRGDLWHTEFTLSSWFMSQISIVLTVQDPGPSAWPWLTLDTAYCRTSLPPSLFLPNQLRQMVALLKLSSARGWGGVFLTTDTYTLLIGGIWCVLFISLCKVLVYGHKIWLGTQNTIEFNQSDRQKKKLANIQI